MFADFARVMCTTRSSQVIDEDPRSKTRGRKHRCPIITVRARHNYCLRFPVGYYIIIFVYNERIQL